ncbi:hypothetical protein MAM1_0018d01631 [Mucor ambiguus]|uniref:Uncharacterized protein n=1 Tax=Mucor ambiguus TaxID=91626 RepID=A0A0C9LRL6_9FUNG|nr:hypothetical protein MAM1_0018d01631 [Mucor ambiguus]
MVTIETTVKVLGHANMPFSIATNVSFKGKNEGGKAVDSKTNDNDGIANAVKAKVINGHAKQEVTDNVSLPPTAKYCKVCIHLRHDFLR